MGRLALLLTLLLAAFPAQALQVYAETATAADNGTNVGCSGETIASTPIAVEATIGGSSGAAQAVGMTINTRRAAVMFQTDTDEPGVDPWDSGDYVVRLNITTANMDMEWETTHICERTTGGTFNTVTSSSADQNQGMGSTGVLTETINRATNFVPDSTSSTLYIVLTISHNNAHGNGNFQFTPDQNINTNIADAGGGRTRRFLSLKGLMRLPGK